MDSKTKVFAVLIILIIVGCFLYYYLAGKPAQDVTDFASCKNAGYDVIAGSPDRCTTPDGRVFKGETVADKTAEIANPASVNCVERNGSLVLRTDLDGGQYGVCVFPSGAECEEWAYYRGECNAETAAALKKEFSRWVGGVAEVKQIGIELKIQNLSDNHTTVYVKASHEGREQGLSIDKGASASFEGYGIEVTAISLKEGATGNKPTDYKVSLKVTKEYKPADYSCARDSDCAIKDIGNLCGEYLSCVNRNYAPVPPEIDSEVCGYPKLDGCRCLDGGCVGTSAGKANIN